MNGEEVVGSLIRARFDGGNLRSVELQHSTKVPRESNAEKDQPGRLRRTCFGR